MENLYAFIDLTLAHTCMPPHVQACEDSTVVLLSLARPTMGTNAVELGSGLGSGARYLAANFGASVECVDLSAEANESNVRLTEEAGLSNLVRVGPSTTFFKTGLPSGSFGFCFSQDAICHAGKQTPRALDEAARLLAPGGTLALTNILRTDEATTDELDEVLVRLQLNHLETLDSFIGHARAAGLELVESLDKTTSMAMHFQALLKVRWSAVRSLWVSATHEATAALMSALPGFDPGQNCSSRCKPSRTLCLSTVRQLSVRGGYPITLAHFTRALATAIASISSAKNVEVSICELPIKIGCRIYSKKSRKAPSGHGHFKFSHLCSEMSQAANWCDTDERVSDLAGQFS